MWLSQSPLGRILRVPLRWNIGETAKTCSQLTYPPVSLRHYSPLKQWGVCRFSSSSRILTACPSPTPFGLSLGPTNPELIYIAQGNLRLSAFQFLIGIDVTHTDIITSDCSNTPYGISSQQIGILPYPLNQTPCGSVQGYCFGNRLKPRTFSARNH